MTIDSVLEIAPIENILISLILPLAGITTIIFSIFSVVSVFYLSRDSEHLLSLPIASKDIMMAKFLVALINEYYILFMFILPCLIGIGVGIEAGAMYYIYTLVIFILLPIIPSIIVTLITLLVTRFTGVVKNKDLFMYISIFLVLSFALAYNFIIQNFININVENIGTTFGSLESQAIPYLKKIFPFYNSASEALMNFNDFNGFFSLITFIAINFISLLVIYLIGDKLYLHTLINIRGNKKKKENIESVIRCKRKSVFSMLLKKEWLIVKRTPVFMLNIVIIVFLMPLILVMSFVMGYSGGKVVAIPDSSVINSYLSNPLAYLIVLVIGVFFTSFSLAASTAISREGNNAWVMKAIPVSYFKQINVKVFFASVLDLLGVVIIATIPICLLKIPLYYAACVLIPLTIIIFIINYINILMDLKRPRIKWNEESVAVKQNLNTFISILLTMTISGVLGIIAFLFYVFKIRINVIILSGIIGSLCGIILGIIIYLFKINERNLLNNVD